MLVPALLRDHTKNNTSLVFIADARERRRNVTAYSKLMMIYGGALIGIKDWKAKHLTASFSQYVTVADEAFLWLCLDTYLPIYNMGNIGDINPNDGQVLMMSHKDTGNDNSATPSTPTGNTGTTKQKFNTSPTATGNRYGWTKEGIMRYNHYFRAITQERKEFNNFDAYFLEVCQANATPLQTPRSQQNKELPALACNCLAE